MVKMENYQNRYETLRINDKPFGRLYIPIIPSKISPNSIIPLIIQQEKKKREIEDQKPFQPEMDIDPSKIH